MTEKEKAILENLSIIIPKMNRTQKNNLLCVAEGMALMVDRENNEERIKGIVNLSNSDNTASRELELV